MSLANKLKCVKLSYYWLTIILITADVSVMAADDSIKASEKKDDLVSSLSPPFLVSPKGNEKEDDGQSQGQDSQSVPLLTKDSEGVGSESEEDPSAIKEHLYSLKENAPL
ncbi:hypothetical protein [Candidatus Paracaedibacter symbiosus]|uniref:hypothetical protein n=1 Tax=Candidatus Paracaedibacter symbiosus TaxID=244582 RepID=UPI000509BF48|nr:hypothetical protein [Candidatus Paracaedibacter symbiosus]